MGKDEQQRLIDNIAGTLSRVSREDIIERSIGHFRNADKDYGERLSRAVKLLRKR
jgi:catalase